MISRQRHPPLPPGRRLRCCGGSRQARHRKHCHSHSGVRSRYCLTVNYTWRPPPKFHDDPGVLGDIAAVVSQPGATEGDMPSRLGILPRGDH
jgi:hypothetical protein